MKLAVVVCTFPPYKSGIGNVAHQQVKGLAKLGHNVTVFTLVKNEKLNPHNLNYKIKYLRAFPRLGHSGFCPQLFWQLKNFDVVILHYPFFGAQEVLWLAKKMKLIKTKLIIQYHMDANFANPLIKLLSIKSTLIRPSLFALADKVVCASLDYVKHSAIKNIYKKHSQKFMEIPFGVSLNPTLITPEKLKQFHAKLKIKPDEKIILFVGGLDSAHYFKGVPILLKAIHKLKDVHIKLIIVGDGNLRDNYQRQAQGLNIQSQVIFAGHVTDNDLPYYYTLCDLFVLPSINAAEAFGLVLAEAQTFGKPVVGSDLPGVRDVVGDNGLVYKPGDAHDLAEKIETILKKNYDSTEIKKNAEKYDWQKHGKRLNNEVCGQ